MKQIPIILILVALQYFSFAQSMQIDVQGSVIFNNALFTITEAGEDFDATLVSEATIYVSVTSGNYWDSKKNNNKKWRIEVNKTDVNWNDNLLLEIRRTGDGTSQSGKGNGNGKLKIQDGTVYSSVTNNATYFFQGKNFISDIPIAFRVSGLSITMGSRDFETDVVLTIYDD